MAESADRMIFPTLSMGELVEFHRRPPTPDGWRFEPSVAYAAAPGRPLVLHLYRPSDEGGSRPGVLFIHGGGWTGGHPFSHIRRAALMASRGWITATMTYRRAAEAGWPAQLDDVRAALAWIRSNGSLGLDHERIAVCGDSAGGQLAALAALDPTLDVAASVLWYPITDLRHLPTLQAEVDLLTAGDAGVAVEASPLSHVHSAAPPILTFAGEADLTVPIDSVRRFHRSLDAAGVDNVLVVRPGAGHAFDFEPASWSETFETATSFLERCFERRARSGEPSANELGGLDRPTARTTP